MAAAALAITAALAVWTATRRGIGIERRAQHFTEFRDAFRRQIYHDVNVVGQTRESVGAACNRADHHEFCLGPIERRQQFLERLRERGHGCKSGSQP